MFGTEQGWRESTKPIHCETAEDVRRLAWAYRRRAGNPVIRLPAPEPVTNILPAPVRRVDYTALAAAACHRAIARMWAVRLNPAAPKVSEIIDAVCREYEVSRADLLSARRTANVVRPRQIAMYLAKTLTLRSLPDIGKRFGGRDHTTVIASIRRVQKIAAEDRDFSEKIERVQRSLSCG